MMDWVDEMRKISLKILEGMFFCTNISKQVDLFQNKEVTPAQIWARFLMPAFFQHLALSKLKTGNVFKFEKARAQV